MLLRKGEAIDLLGQRYSYYRKTLYESTGDGLEQTSLRMAVLFYCVASIHLWKFFQCHRTH